MAHVEKVDEQANHGLKTLTDARRCGRISFGDGLEMPGVPAA